MTTYSRSPRLVKGAIIAIEPSQPVATVIEFQYNPETMSRNLESQIGSEGGGRAEALRLSGPPKETISLDVVINATDQLEKGDSTATKHGIYPQLSALEMLLYPKSSLVNANAAQLQLGTIEIIPPEAPLTLFRWGAQRVVPVNLTSFSITEEAYDTQLNPIRAKVALSMRVLTYDDLPQTNDGYGIFLAHQAMKERLASMGSVNKTASVVNGDVRLL